METVFDAHRALLDMASRAREYTEYDIKHLAENDPTANDIAGKGFDLERDIRVALDASSVAAKVRLRVLAKTNGNLFIRIWLEWTSQFGDHRSFACYDLTPTAINMLAEQASTAQSKEEIDESKINIDDAVALIFDQFDAQEALGTDWQQTYPQLTNECADYHGKLVLAARDTEPRLLNMLSNTELGAAEAQEIIDLLDWLKGQPEVNTLV